MNKFRGAQPTQGKYVRPQPPESKSDSQEYPIFSLRFLDKDYCLSLCQTKEKAAFADTIHKLCQRTWSDIRQLNRHKAGYEKIARNKITGKIPAHITEDVEHFLAFRFYDMAPMVGYKEGTVFYVIWLDRSFKLYDHD